MITKKDVDSILLWGNSHTIPIPGYPMGVTKFQSFLALSRIIKGKLYWHALRNAYERSDNLYDYRYDVKMAFMSKEPEREYLMNKRERTCLQKLPERITIYRGMTVDEYKSNDFGISWSLKKKKAEFFAYTYVRNMATNHLQRMVHKLVIDKNEVIAFFNGRNEFEIIYLSKDERLWKNFHCKE